jgi:hypothetical protein
LRGRIKPIFLRNFPRLVAVRRCSAVKDFRRDSESTSITPLGDPFAAKTSKYGRSSMRAGTIFVLCLAAAFGFFVVYLAVLSRREERKQKASDETSSISDSVPRTKRRL